jgi:UDP-N-acetylglucosamine--N-acetylmuramyl-(pentapeptide) pyrophosphoryl-undecaprenol N-acetylglucosamine transferase
METKNVIIVSSGTGGHIYPGIVLAKELKEEGYTSIFFINDNCTSIEILKASGFGYIRFNMIGMPRKISISIFTFMIKIKITFLKSLIKIITLKPVAVIGMGGYLAVPSIVAAKILKKKTFIHEQNTIPGKANIFLNRIVKKTFITFQYSAKYFKNGGVIISGYPVRKDILALSKEKAIKVFNLKNNIFTVLVFAGSLGSVNLNKIVCETFLDLSVENKIQILHIAGFKNYGKLQQRVRLSPNYRVFDYIYNIADAYAVSDIVICRSGAGTVFELKSLNKRAILIPYPYATDNHQYWNAKEIQKDGEVIIIEEKNLTKELLSKSMYFVKNNIKKIILNDTADTTSDSMKLPQRLIVEEIIKCIRS